MSSLRRIESSRANGALSHGPITPEGKARNSQNALRHGLTGAPLVVLCNEDEDNFQAVLSTYKDYFNPQNPLDEDLVEEMAVAKWRQRRLWSIETAAVDHEMDAQMASLNQTYDHIDEPTRLALAYKALIDSSKLLANLSRYESRHRRAYEKARAKLENENGKNEPNPISGH